MNSRQQAKKWLPYIQAWAEGNTVEYQNEGETIWYPLEAAGAAEWFQEIDEIRNRKFRIKPEPKLRSWKPEEVPVGRLIRWKAGNSVYVIISVFLNNEIKCVGIMHEDGFKRYGLDTLADYCEYSLDGGKTWLPCGVEEK